MKTGSVILTVSIIASIVLVSGCIQQEEITPLDKACSSDMYDRSFFECAQNDLGAKYLATNTDPTIADVPNTYFDENGEELTTCGGLAINTTEQCTALESLTCNTSVSCT